MMMNHQRQVPETSVNNSNSNMDDLQSDHPNHADRRETLSSNGGDSIADSDDGLMSSGIKFEDWGFQVDRLFEVAYRFYKRNENKIFHPSYDERNQLIALILQARYGNFDGGRAPDVGVLDLVGKSRQRYWATLKGMSKTEAMSKFILTLNELCPLFKVHAEAVKISCDSQMPPVVDSSKTMNSSDNKQTNSSATTNAPTSIKKDEKLQAIYTSLCRQTYQQFKGYAIKQYPNDVQQQKYLISSLQEQYYQQYISQMHPELKPNPLTSDYHQLKSSLSPAASETSSSIMHENGDNMSISSSKTDQEQALIDANSSDRFKNIDQVDAAKQPSEVQLQSSTEAPIITTIENTSAPEYEAKLKTESTITNGDGGVPATGQSPEHSYRQAPRQPPVAAQLEAPLPKPNPYQPVDLQSIGKFESFPKPKPIPNNARQAKTTSDVPSTPPKPVADPPKTSPLPEYTAIDFGDEELPSTKEDIPKPANNNQISAPSPSVALPPEQLPPPPPQELPLLPPIADHSESPSQISSSTQHHHHQQQQTKSQSPPLSVDIHNQPIVEQQQQSNFPREILQEEKKPPPELWGCDSSSSSGDEEVDDRSQVEQPSPIVYDSIEPATIWTKRGCNEFKESLVDDKQAGMYVVKQGTLVTIQMPTYPDGRFIYWEFATEDYDIGFGLDFVYESNLAEPLAIKIFEETDEDDDEDCDDILGQAPPDDAEAGVTSASDEQAISSMKQGRAEKLARIANTVSIIPTYRRDSHEEIFVGRHKYPGRGYYLLKFDNTYSVLRSKTIFFRICYFI